MYTIAIFAPLVGFMCAGLISFVGCKNKPENLNQHNFYAWAFTSFMMFISFIIALGIFNNHFLGNDVTEINLSYWISFSGINAAWTIYLDSLSSLMIMIVSLVSLVVHIYSYKYMDHEKSLARYQSYLSIFTFFMYMLVTSGDILQMFFGWEGVGLASYLLVGFWYNKRSANSAAIKAFIVNRFADVFFILGILLVFTFTETLSFKDINSHAMEFGLVYVTTPLGNIDTGTLLTLLLFIGAMGKSAQIGMHVWLADAMEGPTPVSALIHAATMVTAGIYMIARLSPVYSNAEFTLQVITIVGALTAMLGATIGLVQNDIKKIIAYSTVSQLGYMFFGIGVNAYSASMFHLTSHAFFKALLFLSAGSIIYALHHTQDIRKMGNNLWKRMPITYIYFWIGSLALAGIPPFSGYYSKDGLIEKAYEAGTATGMFAYYVGIIAAFFTALYSWRLIIIVFHGKSDNKHTETAVESKMMYSVMSLLALGAIFYGYYFHHSFLVTPDLLWNGAVAVSEHHADAVVPLYVKLAPLVFSGLGILVAYVLYARSSDLLNKIYNLFQNIHQLLLNKYYFDEIYSKLIVKPIYKISGVLWKVVDVNIIDRFGPVAVSKFFSNSSSAILRQQKGYINLYVIWMIVGIILILMIILLTLLQGK